MDLAGNAYVAGETHSDQATFPVVVGPDLTYASGAEAFVVRVVATACATPPAVIARVVAAKSGTGLDDVAMEWLPDAGANGNNVWYVERKDEISSARQNGAPPAIPVLGCAPPASVPGNACVDIGGVSHGTPAVVLYQVRAFCDLSSEGP